MIQVCLKVRPTMIAALISTLALTASPFALAQNFKHYNKPLVINDSFVKANGNVITGDFVGTNSTPALSVSTSTPVTILDSTVTGPGDLIYATNANMTVLNTVGTSTNPNVANQQKGKFIHVETAINIDVENCTSTGPTFGIYINHYSGNFTHEQTIRLLNNVFNNIDGRPSNGNGGYVTDGDYNAHAIQLNNVQSVPDIEIAWNQVVNTPYQSQVNDQMNFYESSGTAASPIMVHDNYLQGAYPANPGVDGYSGGGIITDGTAKDTAATASAFVNIFNNQVVSTANYGISTAAGHDNLAYNNRIISSGFLSNGAFIPMTFSNGINNYNNYNQPTTTFFNNLFYNNVVGLIASTSGTGAPRRSDHYVPGQSVDNNNWWTPDNAQNPTLANEQTEFVLWQEKIRANKIKLGAHLT